MSAPRTVLIACDEQIPLKPFPSYAEAKDTECPFCSKPLRVQGAGNRIGGRDYYSARGYCADCGQHVGEIRAYVSTIFGLEEDERVLNGRPRVY